MPAHGAPREAWTRYAKALAVVTVLYNLAEGLVSMGFGWSDGSLALFGFGADSFIEVFSALLVLWRLRGGDGCEALTRERKATRRIGLLFLALAAGIAGGSLLQLAGRRHPETTLPALIVSALSLGFMVFLWRGKRAAATALDSRALEGDAACSLACIQLSSILFAGSLVFLVRPRLWWVDAAAALALSALIAKEGWAMRKAAAREDFDGGCGCH
ncbi:MAG TPA: cation transporter [Holophagaceae bacterium]|nr:cation transporter [Holophagaceae bacterium]